jgi:hypothetical protein
MKKYYSCAWLLSALALSSTSAFAFMPLRTEVTFNCPQTDALTKSNGQIQGVGTELIFEKNNSIVFYSPLSPPNMPNDFNQYANSAVDYDSTLGLVSCIYVSSDPTQSSFLLFYYMINGYGGTVKAKSNATIKVLLPYGLSGQ